jgi:hypothetical protein
VTRPAPATATASHIALMVRLRGKGYWVLDYLLRFSSQTSV